MERRRLRLHGTDPLTPDLARGGAPIRRVPAPGRCLSVADTEQGNLATVWACDLVEAFAAESRPIGVLFTAFEQTPELPKELARRIASSAAWVEARAVSREPARFVELLSALPEDLVQAPAWLMVGTPALLAYESFMGVLVTGELGPERWPPGLRTLRAGLSLEVAGPRPALASALVRALLTTA